MSSLPADIQEQLDKQRARQHVSPPTGIGSSAPENRRPGVPAPAVQETKDAPVEEAELHCKNSACGVAVAATAAYCSRCGQDQFRGGILKKLGLDPFTEEELQDYVFRGYLVKDVKVMGKHVATLRTSQAKDLREIDNFIMTGGWSKTADGKEKPISDFFMRQMNAMVVTAMAIQKIDGQSIGAELADRVDWIQERGSAFVDIISTKVVLLNQAITEHAQKEDIILGS